MPGLFEQRDAVGVLTLSRPESRNCRGRRIAALSMTDEARARHAAWHKR